ncbi:hypothetical protein [Natronogracilivirga saccharolytica]|uniref:Uncharacterized protein n=1 Tax=Natronogracilivirga saccharolytica TaxID=2812953 RepID=A0A8J7S4M3_9BACT|nr:hypothetical protein [Natronogracilivirga saccharolytica]MBP3191893.1 hypothetical protein [Natronogracilivirga saccharolytica]
MTPSVDWSVMDEIADRVMQPDIPDETLYGRYLALTYIFLAAPSLAMVSYLLFKNERGRFSQNFVMNLYAVSHMLTFSIIQIPSILYQGQVFDFHSHLIYCTWSGCTIDI